jgi:hypothetical protein
VTVIACDKCKAQPAYSIKFINGRSYDGNSYMSDWKYRDLCVKHLVAAFEALAAKHPDEAEKVI